MAKTRGKDKTERFFCSCGGEVKMVSVTTRGSRLRNRARCTKCEKEKRFPKDLA